MRGPGPCGDVVVWRNTLLPASNTFIANQMAALQRFSPRLAGLERAPSGLPVAPALVLGSGGKRLLRWTGLEPRLVRLLADPNTRLTHAHFGVDAAWVMTAARTARSPLVVTFHGYDINRPLAQHTDRLYIARRQRLMRQARALVAVSAHIADQLRDAGAPSGKVHVHHIGIPVPTAVSQIPSHRQPSLLFVGRLVEKKNLAGLLHALHELPPDVPCPPLRVVGEGPLRAGVERLAQELHLDVTFLGETGPDQVHQEMLRATVFVAPSVTAADGDAEGLPIAPLEAAAHRLVTVVGRSGGSSDAVRHGETGMLVDAREPGQIAHALEVLLRNPARARQMGDNGRAMVEQHFDIIKQTSLLEDLYESVARPRR